MMRSGRSSWSRTGPADPPLRGRPDDRPAALKAAADAVWSLFVQREICGQRDHKPVIEIYGIPREVLARLGAR